MARRSSPQRNCLPLCCSSSMILVWALCFTEVAAFAVGPTLQSRRCSTMPPQQKHLARVAQAGLRPATALAAKRRRRRVDTAELEEVEVAVLPLGEEEADEDDSGESEQEPEKDSVTRVKKYAFDLDVELPVESENRGDMPGLSGPAMPPGAGQNSKDKDSDAPRMASPLPDGVVPLPDLQDLRAKSARKAKVAAVTEPVQQVARSDRSAFTKLLELDPSADDDASSFAYEGYDLLSSMLGEARGPFLGIPSSFLQSGHTMLLALTLLAAFIEYPGFPLTQLPTELREFLQQGLTVVCSINVVAAVASVPRAKAVKQPWGFWVAKTLVLGGLALGELSQVRPPPLKKSKGAKRR